MLGIGCFGIVKLGRGWCCGDFHEKNWVGLGVGVSNCNKNWVDVVVGGCGQLKLGSGLGLGVAAHGLIGLGVPKPHFAHPCLPNAKDGPELNVSYIGYAKITVQEIHRLGPQQTLIVSKFLVVI